MTGLKGLIPYPDDKGAPELNEASKTTMHCLYIRSSKGSRTFPHI